MSVLCRFNRDHFCSLFLSLCMFITAICDRIPDPKKRFSFFFSLSTLAYRPTCRPTAQPRAEGPYKSFFFFYLACRTPYPDHSLWPWVQGMSPIELSSRGFHHVCGVGLVCHSEHRAQPAITPMHGNYQRAHQRRRVRACQDHSISTRRII